MDKSLLKTWAWVFGDSNWPTAPPKTVFALTVYCGKTQRIDGGGNGISKQFEKLEAYGWEAAS